MFGSSTFGLYLDALGDTPFTGDISLLHKTDLSDNPNDSVLYVLSLTGSRQLQALSNPGVDDITLTPTDLLPVWEASNAYVLGDRVGAVSDNGFVYQCTTAGTSDSSEPTWPVSGFGSTITDNTVIWTLVAPRHELTENILALSSGDLDTNTPGAALSLGTTILSGTGNAVELFIRINNSVTIVTNNTGHEEIGVDTNELLETSTL